MISRIRYIFFLALLTILAGCAKQEPHAEAEDHIRALVFWHLLKVNPNTQQYFLSFEAFDSATGKSFQSEPSDEFMKQFEAYWIPVRKKSQAPFLPSGQKVYFISISRLKWQENDLVKVGYSVTCGALCGGGGELTIQFTWLGWRITDDGLHWIS